MIYKTAQHVRVTRREGGGERDGGGGVNHFSFLFLFLVFMKSAPVRARGKSGSLASKFYSLRSILIEYFPSQEGGGGNGGREFREGIEG